MYVHLRLIVQKDNIKRIQWYRFGLAKYLNKAEWMNFKSKACWIQWEREIKERAFKMMKGLNHHVQILPLLEIAKKCIQWKLLLIHDYYANFLAPIRELITQDMNDIKKWAKWPSFGGPNLDTSKPTFRLRQWKRLTDSAFLSVLVKLLPNILWWLTILDQVRKLLC